MIFLKKKIYKIFSVIFAITFFVCSAKSYANTNEKIKYGNADIGYKLRIESYDKDKRPLTGFVYKVTNKKTGEVIKLDLTLNHIQEVTMKKGDYTIELIEKPEGYDDEKKIDVSFPLKDHNSLILIPKHIVKVEEPKKEEPKKENPKKEEPKKEERKKEEPRREYPKEEEIKQEKEKIKREFAYTGTEVIDPFGVAFAGYLVNSGVRSIRKNK